MKFANPRILDALNRDFRLQEGIFDEGLATGAQKKAEAVAINLLKMQVSPEIIAQGTELSIEQIQEIAKALKKQS